MDKELSVGKVYKLAECSVGQIEVENTEDCCGRDAGMGRWLAGAGIYKGLAGRTADEIVGVK